jgi:transcriptional regulator with XRE-family HTH domain
MDAPLLSLLAPGDVASSLAERTKALRLLKGWTRDTLASRSGVTPSSLKRFETTGKASLDLVLKVAFALGRLEDFSEPLQPPPAASIEELERQTAVPSRKRGRK